MYVCMYVYFIVFQKRIYFVFNLSLQEKNNNKFFQCKINWAWKLKYKSKKKRENKIV